MRKNYLKQLFVAMLAMLYSVSAAAYDFMVDGLCYNVTSEEALTVEVAPLGGRGKNYSDSVIVVPEKIFYEGKDYSVTAIGDAAFRYCALNSVTIPETVTSIGRNAFGFCSELTNITIPESVTNIDTNAFYNCKNLTTIINYSDLVFTPGSKEYGNIAYYATNIIDAKNAIFNGDFVFSEKDGIKTLISYLGNESQLTLPANCNGEDYVIGDSAFFGKTFVENIVIPEGVTSIGHMAFWKCNNLTTITISNSVTSIESNAFSGCSGLTSITIPNSVTSIEGYAFSSCSGLTSVTIGNSVTSIGLHAFSGCSGLTSITIGNSVTSIGDGAFEECSSLVSVTIPNNVTYIGFMAFFNCSSLTNIIIGNSVTSIVDGAFDGCSELANIIVDGDNLVYDSRENCNAIIEKETNKLIKGGKNTIIPNSVTSIGNSAFSGCSGLESIEIPNSVTSIGNNAFSGCSGLTSITIPEGVTSIGNYAFSNCTSLATVINYSDLVFTPGSEEYGRIAYYATKIIDAKNAIFNGDFVFSEKDGIKTLISYLGNESQLTLPANCNGEDYVIGDSAFFGKTFVENIVIPEGVTSIGKRAFWECKNLTTITIPNSVKNIGDRAFGLCENLSNVTLPEGLKTVEEYLFFNCSRLKSVNLPESITTIGQAVFIDCVALENINIPESVTSMGDGLFTGCTSLTNITLPSGLKTINNGLFYRCSGLKEVTIPEGVASIADDAFSGCSGLESITIPNSVTSIGNGAFRGCSGLENVTIGKSVESIGNYAFSNCTSLATVINYSDLVFTPGSEEYGYVAYYATKVLNKNEIPDNSDFIFVEKNCVYTLVGYTGENKVVALPENYKGSSYVIGDSAFYGNTNIVGIAVPDGVTDIGVDAFTGCTSLARVASLTDRFYFKSQSGEHGNITNYATTILNHPGGVAEGEFLFTKIYGTEDWMLLFYLGNEKDVVLPYKYKGENYSIRGLAFASVRDMESITIPDGVKSIGESAFSACSSLTSITIPSSVKSIEAKAFAYCI